MSVPRLRLRKDRFDQAADDLFGADLTDAQVAARFRVNPAVLSQYRNGRRQPPSDFIAAVLDTFPGARFDQFFEHVTEPVQP